MLSPVSTWSVPMASINLDATSFIRLFLLASGYPMLMPKRRTRVAAAVVSGLLLLTVSACSEETKNDVNQLGSDLKSDAKSNASQADESFDSITSSVQSDNSSSEDSDSNGSYDPN